MQKKIYNYKDVKDKVLRGLNSVADPVRQTLSPKGGDVMIETDQFNVFSTNDGVTIVKNIDLHDQIESAVAEILKTASLKTNQEAGDGTSTTVLLSQVLTKEGLKMKEEGKSRIDIKNSFLNMAENLKKSIKSVAKEIKDDKDLRNIAKISSNNDDEIADYVVDVIKTAGEDGLVFLEPNNSTETLIEKDLGFMIKSGLQYQELMVDKSKPVVSFNSVPVLITDKRIYYEEEAQTILRTAIKAGHSEIVVVARDFIGQAVPTFIKNHNEGQVKVILVKDPKCTETDNTSLDDLAQYLGGKVITDKTGSLVNKISKEDFVIAENVTTDPQKTLFTPKADASDTLNSRIEYLKDELKKDKDNSQLQERLSSLTSGVVTVRVGGATSMEIKEKIYRYEDAVNATRASMKSGYVAGGGISLLSAYNPEDYDSDMKSVAKKYTEAVIRQISENCGKHADTIISEIKSKKSPSYGYNALTDSYGDMLKEGVIDPVLVLEMAIENSVSIANIITGIDNYVVNDFEGIMERKKLFEKINHNN